MGKVCTAISFWPTPGFKEKTFVNSGFSAEGDLNFCVHRGKPSGCYGLPVNLRMYTSSTRFSFCLLLLKGNVDYCCCLCSSFNNCYGKRKERGLVVNRSYSRNVNVLFCWSWRWCSYGGMMSDTCGVWSALLIVIVGHGLCARPPVWLEQLQSLTFASFGVRFFILCRYN